MSDAPAFLPPALTLADGGHFPAVGLGFWKMPKPETPSLVQQAIRAGYRHLDCACVHWNKPMAGEGFPPRGKRVSVHLPISAPPRAD
ncbi:MAG: hypothetical protein ABIQ12_07715 [Opitutaceae bacterium]